MYLSAIIYLLMPKIIFFCFKNVNFWFCSWFVSPWFTKTEYTNRKKVYTDDRDSEDEIMETNQLVHVSPKLLFAMWATWGWEAAGPWQGGLVTCCAVPRNVGAYVYLWIDMKEGKCLCKFYEKYNMITFYLGVLYVRMVRLETTDKINNFWNCIAEIVTA